MLTVGANDTERSLTGLMMGTNYNITIVATNTAGDGNAVVLVQPTHIDRTFMREGGREGGREGFHFVSAPHILHEDTYHMNRIQCTYTSKSHLM